jgi:serine/threonine-protein kinase RsbW
MLPIHGFGSRPDDWMTAETKHIEVTLETLLDSVDLAEDIAVRVAQAAGFDDDTRYRIGMSVREAMINAVEYGNQHSRTKKVHLSVDLEPEKMVIHIRDEGTGFELEEVPDPLAEENLLKTSGRGIFLIRAFMDEFDLRRPPEGGAEVVMAKRYPAPRDG